MKFQKKFFWHPSFRVQIKRSLITTPAVIFEFDNNNKMYLRVMNERGRLEFIYLSREVHGKSFEI